MPCSIIMLCRILMTYPMIKSDHNTYDVRLPVGIEPVVSVSMHSEGRYAFLELRTAEMASAALQLSMQVTQHLLTEEICAEQELASDGVPSHMVDALLTRTG